MRLLHIIPYMHPSAGGPPVVVDQWCAGLKQLGHDVEVITTDSYAPREDAHWQTEMRSRYRITVLKKIGPRGFGYAKRMKETFAEKLSSVDLVHVHNIWGYGSLLAARGCKRRNVRFVVSSHGMLDPYSMGRKSWKKLLYGRIFEFPALRSAAGMIFTHSEEERLARQTCFNLPRGYVVPLGTDDPPFEDRQTLSQEFLRQFPLTAKGPRILFLSRLHEKKGLNLLIPAFQQIVRQHPTTQLVLVGPGDSTYIDHLQAQAKSLDILNSMHFTGPLHGREKWAALASANLYVLPSYQENFAIALVEALRIGTPVVCSQRVNLSSDLQQAGAATICDLTVNGVANAIIRLMLAPEDAQRQGKIGSALAEKKYTWKSSITTLVNAYRAILSDN